MKNIDELCRAGNWMNYNDLNEFLEACNVREYMKAPRHNRTDGECHTIYIHKETEMLFVFHGNGYDSESFRPLLEWAKHR